jgi:oligopeptidase B
MALDSHQSRSLISGLLDGGLNRRQLLARAGVFGLGLSALNALLWELAAAESPAPTPPVARQIPHTFEFGDIALDDPYAWLENPDDPAVIAYLEAENAYTDAMMAPAKALRETLYDEMVGRIQRTDTRIPFRMGEFFYYTRTEEGRDYDILCRKQGSLDAPEQIMLDLNEIAAEYLSLGFYAPSYDGRYLAYALNETGGLDYTLYVKDLVSGETLPDQMPSDGWSLGWAADNNTLFYTRMDETLRPFELYRHELGSDPAGDPMLMREDDPIFSLYVWATDSREFILLQAWSYDSTEFHYLPADQPTGEFTLFAPRTPGVIYENLEHHGDDFLFLTNEDAVNFKLMAAPIADPAPANWREVIAHRDDALLQWGDVFVGYLLLSGREAGLSRLWIHEFGTGETRPVDFDEPVHSVWLGDNREFSATAATIVYTSFVTPITFYELDLVTGERTLLKQEEVVGGHDPSRYVSERLFATAPDGEQIPISLVRLLDAPVGPQPMVLVGYGAYGISMDPWFGSNELSLIDRGITLGLAHVRGGQEMGRVWYEDGKLLDKKNTFSDFIACAEHLIDRGHAAPDRLIATGGSAGGMLIGAVVNARPELFNAIVAEVPFVDVLRVMLDPSQPLTTAEYVEWGDPRDPEYYDYIRSYSPYDNAAARDYPNIFLTAGINDDQVPYWQPAKWTAKLRALKTDDNTLLLRTNLGAGHMGESGFYEAQRERAFIYAFVLMALGMTEGKLAADDLAAPIAETRSRLRQTA